MISVFAMIQFAVITVVGANKKKPATKREGQLSVRSVHFHLNVFILRA